MRRNQKIAGLILLFALAVLCAVGVAGCGPKTPSTTLQEAKITSFEVRRDSDYVDEDHTLCLAVSASGACETVELRIRLDNPSALKVMSFTVNGVEYGSEDFEADQSYSLLKAEFTPTAATGDYTVKLESFTFKYGSQNRTKTVENFSVPVRISPYFTVSLDYSESGLAFREDEDGNPAETVVEESIRFMDYLRLDDETVMNDPAQYGRPGYDFVGWFTEKTGGTQIVSGTEYEYYTDLTLYARYVTPYKTATIEGEDGTTSLRITGLTAYGQELATIAIPATIDGVPVTELGKEAFVDAKATSILSGENVKRIGEQCFYENTYLQSFGFGNVETIEAYAFYGATAMTNNITLPDTLKSIGERAFQRCGWDTRIGSARAEKTLLIPASVASIGDRAFYASTFETVYFADGSALTEESLGKEIFRYCKSLTTVHTGVAKFNISTGKPSESGVAGLAYLSEEMFTDCTALTSLTLAEGLKETGLKALNGVNALTSLTFPESLRVIGESSFLGLKSLTSVSWNGDSRLTTLGKYAFWSCSSLKEITIPSVNLTTYGLQPFYGCSSLVAVYLSAPGATMADGGTVDKQHANGSLKIFVPKASLAYYRANWKAGESVIPGMAALPNRIFATEDIVTSEDASGTRFLMEQNDTGWTVHYVFSDSASVTIPSIVRVGTEARTVTAIGAYVVKDNVTRVVLPSTLETVGKYAFEGIKTLSSINWSDLTVLRTIESNAFQGTAVTSYRNYSATLESIGSMAFYLCGALETAMIDTVSDAAPEFTIGNQAFAVCSALREVSIGKKVKEIGRQAFYSDPSLVKVTVLKAVAPTIYSVGYPFDTDNTSLRIYVNGGVTLENYKTNWKIYSDKIFAIES